MANDISIESKPTNTSSLDFSYIANSSSGIKGQMEKINNQAQVIGQEAYYNRQKMQKAMEQTANNTAETNMQLQKVVEHQNEYIDMLKNQLLTQQQLLEVDEQQFTILKSIFSSGRDAIAVEKEIIKLIQEQIDSRHPLWEYVKDKGGDLAVAGVTAATPVIYTAFKQYLASKGILLP